MLMATAIALIVATALPGKVDQTNPRSGSTTPDADACAEKRRLAANADLNRYAAAARRRAQTIASDKYANAGEAAALADFDKAAKAWRAYRDIECAAVASRWAGGTISSSTGVACETRLTRLRTHVIWQDWLVNLDGSAALPEPPLPKASH